VTAVRQLFPKGLTIADLEARIPVHARHKMSAPPVARPRSLDDLAPRPPLLDPELLPPALRPWLVDVAERLGVPLAAVATPALVSAGALIGSTKRIRPRQYDPDWIETANLWGITVASSGLRKSPTMAAALRPLREIENAKVQEFDTDRNKHAARRAMIERQIKAIERGAGKATTASGAGTTDEERLAELLEQLSKVPTEPPRIFTNDTTPERLLTLAEANPRGILLFRDEMSGLLTTMARRDGYEGFRSMLIEGYSSGAAYNVDRMGRERNAVDPFTISLFGLIQPSVLEPYIRSLNQTEGGDGFFGRFQIVTSVRKDQVTGGIDRMDDAAAKATAFATMRSLDEAAMASLVGNPKGHHRLVQFDPDAQEHFDRWYGDVERQGNELSGSAYATYLSKSPGAAARLAIILHEIDAAGGARHPHVTLEQVQRATGLMDHYADHARLLYAGKHHPHAILARAIARKIEQGKIFDGMSVSKVAAQFDAKARGSTDDVLAALGLLADRHWLTVEQVPNAGARESTVIRLNPRLGGSLPTTPPLKS
jgi:hypothetical protein